MKPKVLLLSPFFSPNIGGVETHLDNLVKFLQDKPIDVHVLTFKPITNSEPIPYKKRERNDNVEIVRHWWPGSDLFHRLARFPILQFAYITTGLLFYTLPFVIRNRKTLKVIHTHGLNAAFVGTLIQFFIPIRLVGSTHAIYNFYPQSAIARVSKWLYSKFDVIHTLSLPSQKELIEIGVPPEKLTVTYYWVDAETFTPRSKKSKHTKCLFIGRLLPIKGLNIVKKLTKRFPSVEFQVIGTGPLEEDLMEFEKKQRNFQFIGKVANEDIPEYLQQCDFLIIPSQYEEGLGRVIIEALYCGIPVIGSNLGGIPEAINDKVGILSERTLEGFVKAVSEILQPNQLEKLKRQTIPYAHKKFGLENAEKIFASYNHFANAE